VIRPCELGYVRRIFQSSLNRFTAADAWMDRRKAIFFWCWTT